MTPFPDDLTPKEHKKARDEFVDMVEDEQIAEGNITVSDTVDGHDPFPELDDREINEDILEEDNLVLLNEEALDFESEEQDSDDNE